jgi:hypothetical protein
MSIPRRFIEVISAVQMLQLILYTTLPYRGALEREISSYKINESAGQVAQLKLVDVLGVLPPQLQRHRAGGGNIFLT